MRRMSAKGKIISYLILAAVLLPLIFSAEVIFVEKQYVRDINQLQNQKLRAEAEVYWLSGQTAYLRDVAKLNAISMNDPEAPAVDLRSFLTTEFVTLGYAQPDGKVQADTSGSGVQNISKQGYFAEAAAGRDYTGQVAGTDWLLNEEVTVVAVPAIVSGTVTGVFYGVIRQETIDTMLANLVPATISEQQVMGRWLAWLGGMYLLGIIPLVLLVYLLRRPKESVEASAEEIILKPVAGTPRLKIPGNIASAEKSKIIAPVAEETETRKQESTDQSGLETPESIAIRKITEMIALNSDSGTPDHTRDVGKTPAFAETAKKTKIIPARKPADTTVAETTNTTPAVVVDRVLAAAAYKGSRAAALKEPVTPNQPEARTVPVPKPEPESQPLPEQEPAKLADIAPQESLGEQQRPLTVQEVMPDLPASDRLTKLYTRSVFEKKIAAQYGKPDIGFIVLSIDGMKVINDFLGTGAGDAIITSAADILKLVGGEACTAARLDGDKFVALFTGVSPDGLEDFKKDIKYHIDLHNLRQPELPLSITTGSVMAKQGESLAAAWERAMQDMESRKAVNRVEARKFIMMSIKRYRRKP